MTMKRREKTDKQSLEDTSEKSSLKGCWRNEEGREPIFWTEPEDPRHRVQKSWRWLAIFEGVTYFNWQKINRLATASIRRFERSLDVWRLRCSVPDKNRGIPNACWRYPAGAHVGWYWLRRQVRELQWWERIVGSGPMSVDKYLVRVHTGSILLGQYWCRLRISIPLIGVPQQHALWKARDTKEPLDRVGDVVR